MKVHSLLGDMVHMHKVLGILQSWYVSFMPKNGTTDLTKKTDERNIL